MANEADSCFNLTYLPDIALEKILSFLSYDEVAKTREVCKKFNEISGKYLTRGFIHMERRHAAIYKKVKSLLPRRESERKLHPLAKHCDILSGVETRISMLNMTFMKYIENNMCCFIPGKVIDEIDRVLSLVETCQCPPRTHEFLQELRDISSMAMEHFDEHILPDLKLKPAFNLSANVAKSSRVFLVQNNLAEEIRKVKKQNNVQKQQLTMVSSHILQLCVKLKKQNSRLKGQTERIQEQERKIQEQTTKIQEQENLIADLKKHMQEWDQKISDLGTELVRTRDELSGKSTSQSATKFQSPIPLQQQKYYRSNIKPRTAQILPLLPFTDVDRKRKSSPSDDIPMKVSKNSSGDDIIETPCTALLNQILPSKPKPKDEGLGKVKDKVDKEYTGLRKTLLSPNFISDTIESIIKTPISKLKSRKRKSNEEIDLQ